MRALRKEFVLAPGQRCFAAGLLSFACFDGLSAFQDVVPNVVWFTSEQHDLLSPRLLPG